MSCLIHECQLPKDHNLNNMVNRFTTIHNCDSPSGIALVRVINSTSMILIKRKTQVGQPIRNCTSINCHVLAFCIYIYMNKL